MKRQTIKIGKKILLIGEHPDTQLFTDLQQDGYEVVTCESPQKAWGLVYPHPPHCIFVHLHRPSTRDIAVLQECRALAAGRPVIVATAVPGYEPIIKALEAGATAFLFLPIEPEAIRKVLDGLALSATHTSESEKGGYKMRKKPSVRTGKSKTPEGPVPAATSAPVAGSPAGTGTVAPAPGGSAAAPGVPVAPVEPKTPEKREEAAKT